MRGWLSPTHWRGRALLAACVIVLPFAGFLVSHGYPFLRIESLAALACLALLAAAFGAICRGSLFYALTLVLGCAVAAAPLQRMLYPLHAFSLTSVALGAGVLGAGMMLLLRQEFFRALAVFAGATFLAHVGVSWHDRAGSGVSLPHAVPAGKPAHFLYLVLDEHIGPAGLPAAIEECREAARSIEDTFSQHGFRLYPFAYSNFPMTLDSLPSVMNRQIPRSRRLLLDPGSPDVNGVHFVDARGFFARFRSAGYRINVFQFRSINFARGVAAEVEDYTPRLGALDDVDGSWALKFRLLVGTYQNSDSVLARVKGFFPFRFGARLIGPLALPEAWPETLLEEIRAARQPTLFFVHLLTPHSPYAFREDGTVRDVDEWIEDADYRRLATSTYVARYSRYAEQVEFLQSQLQRLFEMLDQQGLFDPMTVVVHGDHGSRIRRREAQNVNLSEQAHLDRFDYTGPPDLQDLLDRFSALLAIKKPHQYAASTVRRKGSILRFLSEDLYREDPARFGSAVDSVFLFEPGGAAKEIRLREIWNR